MKHHEEVIIWWKLAVEMIVDEQKSRLQEVTPQSVAGEVYSRFYYLDTFPQFEELINACGSCLSRGKGDLPVELDPSADINAAFEPDAVVGCSFSESFCPCCKPVACRKQGHGSSGSRPRAEMDRDRKSSHERLGDFHVDRAANSATPHFTGRTGGVRRVEPVAAIGSRRLAVF